MLLRATLFVGVLALLGVAAPAHARDGDTVECRSRNYKYTECEVPFRHPQLVQQLSDAECVANQSWGYNRNTGSVWVSEGCAAVFAGGGDRSYDRDRDNHDYSDRRDDRDDDRHERSRREEIIECRSSGYAFTRCGANWRRGHLVEQLSNASCVEGNSWGIDEDGLWVDKGCAGRFAGH
jgi:hypothetical protein